MPRKKIIGQGRNSNGEGSIYAIAWADEEKKIPTRYRGAIMDGYKPNGRPNMVYRYGKTKKEVRDAIDDYKKKNPSRSPDRIVLSSYPLGELMLKWLKEHKVDQLKPTSYSRLFCTVTNQILPYPIAKLSLDRITVAHVDEWKRTLVEKYKDNGYSTVKKAYEALNNFYTYLQSKDYYQDNPVAKAGGISQRSFNRNITPNSVTLRYYTKEEARLLINTATRKFSNGAYVFRLGQAYNLLLNTGMRAAELCGLRWSDCLFDYNDEGVATSCRIRILNTVVSASVLDEDGSSRRKKIYQDSAKTKAGTRTIPLNKEALEALLELKKITGDQANNTNGLVIVSRNGGMLDCSALDHTWRRILKESGLYETKNYGIHALRHTFATFLFDKKLDIKDISQILGHSSTSVTLDIYVHVIPESLDTKIKSIDSLYD